MKESGEMYLETIHILSQKGDVRSIDVAEYMGFSKPSVSRAVSILKNDGCIETDANGYLLLTNKGLDIAEKMYERHKLLTEALIRIGVSEDIAQKDACKIEHDISDETFETIKTHLSKFL